MGEAHGPKSNIELEQHTYSSKRMANRVLKLPKEY